MDVPLPTKNLPGQDRPEGTEEFTERAQVVNSLDGDPGGPFPAGIFKNFFKTPHLTLEDENRGWYTSCPIGGRPACHSR